MSKKLTAVIALLLVAVGPVAAQRAKSPARDVSAGGGGGTQTGGTTNSYEQGLDMLAQKIISSFRGNQKKSIAVLDFEDVEGNKTRLGKFLAEELTTRLFESGKFDEIVERQKLERIIAVNREDLSDLRDSSTAQKLGQLAGVAAVVIGSTTNLTTVIKVNARIVDTVTGKVMGAAGSEVVVDQRIKPLLATIATAETRPAAGPARGGEQPARKTRRVQTSYFTFEVKQCVIAASTVTCEIAITNNHAEREFKLYGSTTMVDGSGVQYRAADARLGSRVLVTDVATPGQVVFNQVNPRATKIALLKLECYAGGLGRLEANIPNIPLYDENGERGAAGAGAGASADGNEVTLQVQGNQPWTDSNVDVSAGMKVTITAAGRIYISDGSSMADKLKGVVSLSSDGGKSSKSTGRSAGTDRLLLKIAYHDGGESAPVVINDSYTLQVQRAGRLFFGIKDNNLNDNSGAFDVQVRW